MESIAVEAIRQIPAFMLAILAFYFYRSARKSEARSNEPATISAELQSELRTTSEAVEQVQSEIAKIKESVGDFEALTNRIEASEETIRSQLSNQKMALKEFGRVLSKTSEQTYTEFGSFEDRLTRIEEGLKERGLIEEGSRSEAA